MLIVSKWLLRIGFLLTVWCFLSMQPISGTPKKETLRLGIIGLVHDHVNWIFNRKGDDVEVVGIVENNKEAIKRYKERYKLPDSLFFETYEALLQHAKPEAVSAFNETKEHLEVVAFFSPKGIPVMVEKPIAATYEDAQKMAAIAAKNKTLLLVNYETSWYESTYEANALVKSGAVGPVTRMVFNTGHPGPKEIGCSAEFLEWLTDPVLNGGGALTDFGCYGANIATWVLKGETPKTVTCVTTHTKPDLYPKVEDDAAIILNYASTQILIQASWNWSHNRKDMEIYGTKGYIYCTGAKKMNVLKNSMEGEKPLTPAGIEAYQKDPFRMLYEMVHQGRKLEANALYSVENNLIVSKILSLAKRSAELGRTVNWNEL
jgi:predicted dehydrogenase